MEVNAAQRQRDLVIAYKKVFESEHGKMVLENMEQAHHVHSSVFDPLPHKMALHEGERTVVLRIKKYLAFNIEALDERIKNAEQDITE